MANIQVVSFSELQTARTCPLKHQLTYIERWTSEKDPMSALSKGTAWHRVMEVHYSSLQSKRRVVWAPSVTWADRERALLNYCRVEVDRVVQSEILPVSADLADLVWWMYLGYVEQWGADSDWRVLAVEHSAQCRLPTPSGRPSKFVLKMKIDLIVEVVRPNGNRQVLIVDHKSGKDLPKGVELDLDDQFGLYTWGLQKMGKPVFGQVHNAARTLRLKSEERYWQDNYPVEEYQPGETQPLEDRFLRTPMYRTNVELERIAVEAYQVIQGRYAEQQRATRAGTDAPRHPDPKDCRWMCDFVEPCLMGRKTDGDQMREYLRAKGMRQDFDRH